MEGKGTVRTMSKDNNKVIRSHTKGTLSRFYHFGNVGNSKEVHRKHAVYNVDIPMKPVSEEIKLFFGVEVELSSGGHTDCFPSLICLCSSRSQRLMVPFVTTGHDIFYYLKYWIVKCEPITF